MDKTTYYDLNKPLGTEKYNIDVFNDNVDIIDNELHLLNEENISQNEAIKQQNRNIAAHLINTTNPHRVDKTQVGLSNVDNTSDMNKPLSLAQAEAINLVENNVNNRINNHVRFPNGEGFYVDYQNGQYGYNTDPERGADTFTPFRSKIKNYGFVLSGNIANDFPNYIDFTSDNFMIVIKGITYNQNSEGIKLNPLVNYNNQDGSFTISGVGYDTIEIQDDINPSEGCFAEYYVLCSELFSNMDMQPPTIDDINFTGYWLKYTIDDTDYWFATNNSVWGSFGLKWLITEPYGDSGLSEDSNVGAWIDEHELSVNKNLETNLNGDSLTCTTNFYPRENIDHNAIPWETGLEDGKHFLSVQTTDNAGNAVEKKFPFYVQYDNPSVTFSCSGIEDEKTYTDPILEFQVSAYSKAGINYVEVSRGGYPYWAEKLWKSDKPIVSQSEDGVTMTYDISIPLKEGKNELRITAVGFYGENIMDFNIYGPVDRQSPQILNYQIEGSTVYNTEEGEFYFVPNDISLMTWDVCDNDVGVRKESISARIDNDYNNVLQIEAIENSSINGYNCSAYLYSNPNNQDANPSGPLTLDDGIHTVTINAADNNYNNHSTTYNFCTEYNDESFQIIVDDNIYDGRIYNISSVPFGFTCKSPVGIKSIKILESDNILWQDENPHFFTNGLFHYDATISLHEGTNNITITAERINGQSYNFPDNLSLVLDPNAPSISNISLSPNPAVIGVGRYININIEATDSQNEEIMAIDISTPAIDEDGNVIYYDSQLAKSDSAYIGQFPVPNKSSFTQDDHYIAIPIKIHYGSDNKVIPFDDKTPGEIGDALKLVIKEKTLPEISNYSAKYATLCNAIEGSFYVLSSESVDPYGDYATFYWTITDNDSGVDIKSVSALIDGTYPLEIQAGDWDSWQGVYVINDPCNVNFQANIWPISDKQGNNHNPAGPLILDAGIHTLTISANDNDGNTAEQVYYFFNDGGTYWAWNGIEDGKTYNTPELSFDVGVTTVSKVDGFKVERGVKTIYGYINYNELLYNDTEIHVAYGHENGQYTKIYHITIELKQGENLIRLYGSGILEEMKIFYEPDNEEISVSDGNADE